MLSEQFYGLIIRAFEKKNRKISISFIQQAKGSSKYFGPKASGHFLHAGLMTTIIFVTRHEIHIDEIKLITHQPYKEHGHQRGRERTVCDLYFLKSISAYHISFWFFLAPFNLLSAISFNFVLYTVLLSVVKGQCLWFEYELILSQTNLGFNVSEVEMFWKHWQKEILLVTRNFSFPTVFSICLKNFLLFTSNSKLLSANSFYLEV